LTVAVESCEAPLSHGRACVHTAGIPHRHSHTWQEGDARMVAFSDGRVINMESGELAGCFPPVDAQGLRHDLDEELSTQGQGQEHAKSVLRQYGFKVDSPRPFQDFSEEEMNLSTLNVNWHYSSGYASYGVTDQGHDVMRVNATGRVSRIYSPRAKQDAVDYARRFTAAAASRKFSIPVKSIRTWMTRGIG
jgi:hypothetical protein